MRPVKLTIIGSYWDSFIYEGKLLLFTINGSIRTLNWDILPELLAIRDTDLLAFNISFNESNLLYDKSTSKLLTDHDLKHMILSKFGQLTDSQLVFNPKLPIYNQANEIDNLFPFPHADVEVYNRTMYLASKSGISKCQWQSRSKIPLTKRPDKLWDCQSLNISASYGNLAVAAGNEGMFEVEIGESEYASSCRFKAPTCISKSHCSSVDWNYYSIFGSSHISSGVLAYQNLHQKDDNPSISDAFDGRLYNAQELFGNTNYSWGAKDKIYQAVENEIKVIRFNPYKKDHKDLFTHCQSIRLQPWKGGVVTARVASFGTVVELDNAIIVIRSDGNIDTIPGEPVQWRIFPRSKYYENQLHVMYEDRLEIYSYNHDIFVDQKEKTAGYSVRVKS